jgi:hypothetical protein
MDIITLRNWFFILREENRPQEILKEIRIQISLFNGLGGVIGLSGSDWCLYLEVCLFFKLQRSS